MKRLLIIATTTVFAIAVALLIHHRLATNPSTKIAVASPVTPVSAELQQKLVLVRAACGGRASVDAEHSVSCLVCPQNSDDGSPADSPSEQTGADGWKFSSVLYGHFSAADADEALVRTSGCESHANSFGGDFLLQRIKGSWKMVRYASGATADDHCQKLTWTDGRDATVCETGDMHQGIASDAVQLLLFDATKPPDDDFNGTSFLLTTDESANCGLEPEPHAKPRRIQIANVDSVKLLPSETAGRQDVSVQTTISRVQLPHTANDTCPKGESHTYRILFRNMGDHFEASTGYAEIAALKEDDCCDLEVGDKVRPGRF
jgi:hypothetical protein